MGSDGATRVLSRPGDLPTAPAPKPHLSHSQLSMLARCGMQYYYRYIEGRLVPPGVAMVVGSATHKGIEANLGAKIGGGAGLPLEEVRDTAVSDLRARWEKEGVELTPEEAADPAGTKGAAADTVVALSTLHHAEVAPLIKPVHVERRFRLNLERYPRDLEGIIDVQEPGRVRDTKTSAKSPPEGEADDSLQLTVYALASRTLDGALPKSVHLDYLVKTKTPKAVSQSSTRGESDFRALLAQVEAACRVIEAGAFYPTDPSNWVCSARWCGYWNDVCPFGRRRKVQA